MHGSPVKTELTITRGFDKNLRKYVFLSFLFAKQYLIPVFDSMFISIQPIKNEP
jgi:hypothetical protein